MTIKSTRNSEHYQWGNQCDGWHLAKTGTLSVIQERVPPGCAEAEHYHQKSEQFFYVLSGVATLEVDGKIFEIPQRNGIHVPAGVVHQLQNKQLHDLEFIVISTPPSHGDKITIES